MFTIVGDKTIADVASESKLLRSLFKWQLLYQLTTIDYVTYNLFLFTCLALVSTIDNTTLFCTITLNLATFIIFAYKLSTLFVIAATTYLLLLVMYWIWLL